MTCLAAEVAEKQEPSSWGGPLVRIEVKMTNQEGQPMASGKVDVELPR